MYSFYEGLDSLATSLKTAFWIILVVTVIIRVIAANKFNEIAQQKGHDGYFG